MTAPSLLDELEGVVRLAEKATPGPFVVDEWGDVTANVEDVARIATDYVEGEPDAHLFADAVNFIRAHHAEIADMAKRLGAAERELLRTDCRWAEDEAGNWNTDCGGTFSITEGTPAENNMTHCCYCGGGLVQHRFDLSAATQEGEG